jgi:hypothetical protein
VYEILAAVASASSISSTLRSTIVSSSLDTRSLNTTPAQGLRFFDRGSLGVRQHAVYRGVSDPNDITVWHDFDDRATAEAFAGSDDLKATMTEAGVVSAPNIWITDEA